MYRRLSQYVGIRPSPTLSIAPLSSSFANTLNRLHFSGVVFVIYIYILQMHIHVCNYTIIYIPIYIHTYIYICIYPYIIYIYIFISRYTTQYCILVDIYIPMYILCPYIDTYEVPRWVNSMSCYCVIVKHTLIWNASARDITQSKSRAFLDNSLIWY